LHPLTHAASILREVQEGATELRLLLCREKMNNGKRGVSVVTACGIFVKDILEAVPIDKYFEMFKPVTGLEGGYIRLRMKLVSPADLAARDHAGAPVHGAAPGRIEWAAQVVACDEDMPWLCCHHGKQLSRRARSVCVQAQW